MSRELLDRAAEAIETSIAPAYASLSRTVDELRAGAFPGDGVSQLPDGAEYYEYTLRHHTTLDLTADQVHQLGLEEVARIKALLDERFAALGYPADRPLPDQIAQVAMDAGFVQPTEVKAAYEEILTDAQSRLDEAFDVLPSQPLIVIAGDGGGFYVGPSLDGSRPGAFYASVSDTAKFAHRSLAYHEGVPGHHLAIGIAQDLDLPLMRRIFGFTGFDEGWALYAEWLAGDLGWYEGDPYGDIGRLQAEAFRAARLVIDTGIHTKGWTFDEAVAYFIDNVGFREGEAEGQVHRYIAWPGQATAYQNGSLHIRALRQEAEAAQGASFDLRAFHRAVLTHGSVPLPIMTSMVKEELGLP